MKRRQFIYSSASSASAIALAGCIDFGDQQNPSDRPNGTEPSQLVNGSFENGLDGWDIGKNLPDVPGGSEPVDSDVSITNERASDGDQAVSFYIEGIADDGTIWLEQAVDLTEYDTFMIDAYSQMKSFNILSQVAFFAGDKPSDGFTESDFDRDNEIEDHQGWKTYEYSVSDVEGEKTIAVGMNVIWETDITRLFDNARLE